MIEWVTIKVNASRWIIVLYLGEAPVGKPHASGVREEDIELVDAQFDKDGNVVVGQPAGDERSQDELEAERQQAESDSDDDDDEPKSKRKMR